MTRRFSVNITSTAQTDADHVYSYIAEDSPGNTVGFIQELEEKCSDLETFPDRYPFIPENQFFETEYRHLVHKEYRIVYRVSERRVFILRILHGSKLLDL